MTEQDKKIQELRSALHDCRNDFCESCGKYEYSYKGACDNCRWAFGKYWETL